MEEYLVLFSNDGTTLKPSIQFRRRQKCNVGLEMHDMTYNKCKPDHFIEKEVLLKKIVCEVVVSSVNSQDNNACLPVAFHYASKSGKSGDNIKCIFSEQIRLIHMWENCISKTEDVNLILQGDKYLVSKSYWTI